MSAQRPDGRVIAFPSPLDPRARNAASNPALLEAGFLMLVERAAGLAFAAGPSRCAEFVGSLDDELSAKRPQLDILRRLAPQVAEAEEAAMRMLRARCAACLVSDCERAPL